MFVALVIAGEDNGQMRPGLASAVEEGREIVVIERSFSAPVQLPERTDDTPPLEVAVVPEPVDAAPAPAVIEAAYTPPDAEARAAEVAARRAMPEPVFTLSALPTIGADEALPAEEAAAAVAATEAEQQAGDVWYVQASSVNVRQGPSTDTSVIGKLGSGEAVTVIGVADAEWVQIVIEGDGIEGYVASRFLSPATP